MGIRDYQFYHGAALLRLLHDTDERGLNIAILDGLGRGCYILEGHVGIYVKHSSKRMPPWLFTFHRDHLTAVELLRDATKTLFAFFVCHDDGVVAIPGSDLASLLGHDAQSWVRVERRIRGMYSVTGSGGKLERRVAGSSFDDVFAAVGDPTRARSKEARKVGDSQVGVAAGG